MYSSGFLLFVLALFTKYSHSLVNMVIIRDMHSSKVNFTNEFQVEFIKVDRTAHSGLLICNPLKQLMIMSPKTPSSDLEQHNLITPQQ